MNDEAAVSAAPLTPALVLYYVAMHCSVSVADLKGPRRPREVSQPRSVAMTLMRVFLREPGPNRQPMSYPHIGAACGGKDHSSVIVACRRVKNQIGKVERRKARERHKQSIGAASQSVWDPLTAMTEIVAQVNANHNLRLALPPVQEWPTALAGESA